MITSSGNVVFESGSIQKYSTPDIYSDVQYFARTRQIIVSLQVCPSGVTDFTVATFQMRMTKSDVDAKTGSDTGDTAKFLNAVEQVVKDNLVALNPGITFTIV